MDHNIFEQATEKKLRFPTDRGFLTVENLWDLPLQARDSFDLDTIAKGINRQIKEVAEESFVATTTNPAKVMLELQLDVLKHIIAMKIAKADAAKSRAEKAALKERLIAVLANKQDQSLQGLSEEEITKRIAELG